jgi:hypothetical protein
LTRPEGDGFSKPLFAKTGKIDMKDINGYEELFNKPRYTQRLGSRWAWIMDLKPQMFGRLAQQIGYDYFVSTQHQVSFAPPQSPFRLMVDGQKVEIKSSRLWDTGFFVFQQIRPTGSDMTLLIGVAPHMHSGWLVPSQVLWENATRQHTEAVRWLWVKPTQPDEWINHFMAWVWEPDADP